MVIKLDSYIADKYSRILTKEDVNQLFNKLTEKLQGNRSEAARQCGLTGKATYDWEKAGYVKLETKRKVLEVCLNNDFLETIEYLLSRSSERTVDILRTILSTIYAEAIETNSREQFRVLLNKFDALKIRYRGLIRDQIEKEVAEMTWLLGKKALELEMPLRKRPIADLSAQELLEAIRLIGSLYAENPTEAKRFAIEDLGIPLETLETILPTFKELSYMKEVEVATKTSESAWPKGEIPTNEYFAEKKTKKKEKFLIA